MTRLLAAVCSLVLMTAVAYATENLPAGARLRVANRVAGISSEDADLLIGKVRPYAAMSELAYRGYSTAGKERQKREATKQRAEEWAQLESWLAQQHWEFLGHKESPCVAGTGGALGYDLWINKMAMPPQVVLAFGGADGDAPPSEPRERELYAAVHSPELRKELGEACRAAGPDVVVSATGDSLGGGLAQHLFYYSQLWPANQVRQATVFEPTPLPARYDFGSEAEREKMASQFTASLAAATLRWSFPEVMAYQYGFGIVRVNEREEPSALRALFGDSEPEPSYLSVLNFNFREEGAAEQSEMAKLAQDLYYYPAAPPCAPRPPGKETRVASRCRSSRALPHPQPAVKQGSGLIF